MEVKGRNDVEIIKQANLKNLGLATSEPKKIDPSIAMLDVERRCLAEDLKEEILVKNFACAFEREREELKERLVFRYAYKGKQEDKVNWVVRLPASCLRKLLEEGRLFAYWRTYRVRIHLGIRCFRCHGYGHFTRDCSVPDQLCDYCGGRDHEKQTCSRKENPTCVNCTKFRRKDIKHHQVSNLSGVLATSGFV